MLTEQEYIELVADDLQPVQMLEGKRLARIWIAINGLHARVRRHVDVEDTPEAIVAAVLKVWDTVNAEGHPDLRLKRVAHVSSNRRPASFESHEVSRFQLVPQICDNYEIVFCFRQTGTYSSELVLPAYLLDASDGHEGAALPANNADIFLTSFIWDHAERNVLNAQFPDSVNVYLPGFTEACRQDDYMGYTHIRFEREGVEI